MKTLIYQHKKSGSIVRIFLMPIGEIIEGVILQNPNNDINSRIGRKVFVRRYDINKFYEPLNKNEILRLNL